MSLFQNGDKIGPYTIRETVGQGGMATVYQAWHEGLHRFEALKVPRGVGVGVGAGGGDPDSAYIQRLLAEARVAAGLQHPHIVAIHSVSEPLAPIPFFAMDWVEGQDLAKILAAKRCFSLDETIEILEPVAEALDYAHSRGVVHRDIKPANILIEEKAGRLVPRVVDFGISRAAEDEDGATKLTKSGMIVGTPEYMSPEQAGSGEVVDYRTDLYSLAVVAYEMLCGGPPFTAGSGVSRLSILISHVRDVAPLFAKCPDFPPRAGEVLLAALSKSPTDRPRSCREFLTQLKSGATMPFHLEASETGASATKASDEMAERTPFDESRFDIADDATLCEPPPTPLSVKSVVATASGVATAVASSPAETALEARSNATYSLRARLETAQTPSASPPLAPTAALPVPRIETEAMEAEAGETVAAAIPPAAIPSSVGAGEANRVPVRAAVRPHPAVGEAIKTPKVVLPAKTAKAGTSKDFFQAASLPGTETSAPKAGSRIAVLAAGCGLVVGAALVFVILSRNSASQATAEAHLAPRMGAPRGVEAPKLALPVDSAPKFAVRSAPVVPSAAKQIVLAPVSRPLAPKVEAPVAPKIEPRVRVVRSRPAREDAPTRAPRRRDVERPRQTSPRDSSSQTDERRVESPPVASRPRVRRVNRLENRPETRPAVSRVVRRSVERAAPRVAPRVVNVRRSNATGRRPRVSREAPLPP